MEPMEELRSICKNLETKKKIEKLLKKHDSMPNKMVQCVGCSYNTFKTKGGHGKLCNGITQEKHQRCPEWRINELKEDFEDNREILKTLACPPWERKFMQREDNQQN